MKILLIGHSIIDHFENDTDNLIFPGGIYYSTLGLLSVCKSNDEIFLLTGFNDKSLTFFKNIYDKINLTYTIELNNMPEVILKANTDKEREEVYKNISSTLKISHIDNWNQFDGILINMITGFDISLDDLTIIRKYYHGKIYFDVHTLSRGVDVNMNRYFRKIPSADEWLNNVDFIQCNETEIKTISAFEREGEIIDHLLKQKDKILLITRGKSGVSLFYKKDEVIESFYEKGIEIKQLNNIGCGDIFGAVFFYSYLCSKDLHSSLVIANKKAALAASIKLSDKPELFLK